MVLRQVGDADVALQVAGVGSRFQAVAVGQPEGELLPGEGAAPVLPEFRLHVALPVRPAPQNQIAGGFQPVGGLPGFRRRGPEIGQGFVYLPLPVQGGPRLV